jgi:hypothetical protein
MLAIVASITFGGLFSSSANADEVGADLPFSIVGNVK